MVARAFALRSGLFAVALLWLLPAPPALSQETGSTSQNADSASLHAAALDATAAEIAGQLRCPVCRNQSVLESSAAIAREMHRLIREKLADGESPEAITEYFVSKYGEWVLLKPEPSGINLLVYLLPLALVVVAAGVLQGRIRSWVRAGTAARTPTFPTVRRPSDSTDSVSATEAEQFGGSAGVSARLSGDNERWLEEALRE